MAAAFAVFGSSISGLVRWLFGRWVPSWQQLVYNKVLLITHCTCAHHPLHMCSSLTAHVLIAHCTCAHHPLHICSSLTAYVLITTAHVRPCCRPSQFHCEFSVSSFPLWITLHMYSKGCDHLAQQFCLPANTFQVHCLYDTFHAQYHGTMQTSSSCCDAHETAAVDLPL